MRASPPYVGSHLLGGIRGTRMDDRDVQTRSVAGSLLEEAAELTERSAPAAHPADRHVLAVLQFEDRGGTEALPGSQTARLTGAAHAGEVLERAIGRQHAGRLRAASRDTAKLLFVRAPLEASLQRVADEYDADAGNTRVDRDYAFVSSSAAMDALPNVPESFDEMWTLKIRS